MAAVPNGHSGDRAGRKHVRGPSRRTLPHNLDAEASIIGGVLLRNEVLQTIHAVAVDDFYDHRHKVVWTAVRNLEHRAEPIDVVTLEAEIEKQGKLEAIGGVAFLGELALRVPTPDNVEVYARRVQELHTLRRVAVLAAEILERSYEWDYEVDELVAEGVAKFSALESDFRSITRRAPQSGLRLRDCIANLRRNRTMPMFTTGFPQIDAICRLMGGQVALLIGGSGSGKSTLTFQVMQHHARTGPVLLVSLELAAPEVAARFLSQVFDVSWFGALRGEVSDGAMAEALDNDRIRVVDDSVMKVSAIRTHVLALQREYPGELVMVVVDYAQLVDAEGKDMRERMMRVVEGLRAIAKELGVMLWLVSQTSRQGAKDLRDGSAVGRDAGDTGAESSQLERATYVTLSLGEMTDSDEPGVSYVDLSIGKVRMGAPDSVVPLRYDGRRGTWREAGEPVSATAHREARAAKKKGGSSEARVNGAVHAIRGLLSLSDEPLSISKIRSEIGINKADCSAATARLLEEEPQQIVRVRARKVGGAWPLWTYERAGAARMDIVPRGVA